MAKRKNASQAAPQAETKVSASNAPGDKSQEQTSPFPIVGIGASAGGLAALRQFFAHVPEDSGLAYVVVVHLSPEHKSHLAELLQPAVKMPVQQVTDTVALE
jgi:two-component system, chemotaxis family, CheB/CheR fusion protein